MRALPVILVAHYLSSDSTYAQVSKPVEIDDGLLKISVDEIAKTWSLYVRESSKWKSISSNKGAL